MNLRMNKKVCTIQSMKIKFSFQKCSMWVLFDVLGIILKKVVFKDPTIYNIIC